LEQRQRRDGNFEDLFTYDHVRAEQLAIDALRAGDVTGCFVDGEERIPLALSEPNSGQNVGVEQVEAKAGVGAHIADDRTSRLFLVKVVLELVINIAITGY